MQKTYFASFFLNFACFLYKNVINLYNRLLLNKKGEKMRKNRERERERERVNASLLANLLFSRMNLIHIL